MLPESDLVMGEITLRKLSMPDNLVSRKSIVRWLALALGIISEKESRQLGLVIFESIVSMSLIHEPFTSNELIEKIKQEFPSAQEKAIRYHISQFKKRGILFEQERKYYLGNPLHGQLPETRLRKLYMDEFSQAFDGIEKAFQRSRNLR